MDFIARLLLTLLGPLAFTAAGVQPAAAQPALAHASLKAYTDELKLTIPGKGSNAFVQPTRAEVDAFGAAIHRLLRGDMQGAVPALTALRYEVRTLHDKLGKSYWVVQERPNGFRGLGTYLVDPTFVRNVVVEVPHPLSDLGTLEEGVQMFQALDARSLYIAGTHRCANPDAASGCSGTTTSCGKASIAVRVSDASHMTQNFMQAAHAAGLRLKTPPVSLNLHGNASEIAEVTLSDGTRHAARQTALVNRLRRALNARSVTAASCNWARDGLTSENLCGTTNVQGRLSNGSPKPCTVAAAHASGLFLHIEQHLRIRDDPTVLIQALREVLPAR